MGILAFLKKKRWLSILALLLVITLLGDLAAIACTRGPKNYLVVASAGGDFSRLSEALKSIADASATNRYTIVVQGRIVEDGNQPGVDGYIDAKSHVDVIGQGATIELWVPEATGRDYGIQFLDVTDAEWRDLAIIIKELWDQKDFEYTGDNSSYPFEDIGIGSNMPIDIRGKTDRTARLVNIKTSWDWQAGTTGWSYGGAMRDVASPTIIDSEFRGGPWDHSPGFIMASIGSPLLINSRFVGGGGSGGRYSSGNYGLIISDGTPTLIGGVAEGGLGSIVNHAVFINGGEPTLVGLVGKPQEFSYAFTYDTTNPPANGQFRPDIGADFRYLMRNFHVDMEAQSSPWTIKVGTEAGGAEVGSISGSGNMTYPYLGVIPIKRYVSNAGDYLYISTSGITGKIYVRYTVMPAIGEEGYITAGLYLGKTRAKIIGSTFYGTWAWNPPLGISSEASLNPEWEITSSSFVQLWEAGIDSAAYSAMNYFSDFLEMPAYNSTFQGDFYNVRPADWPSFVETFTDVLPASNTYIVNGEGITAAIPITFTIANQPDKPRTLSWLLTHNNLTEAQLLIVGIDASGWPRMWSFTANATNGWSGSTGIAFSVVNRVSLYSREGTGKGDTLSIGIEDKLGLANLISETADVYKVSKNNRPYMLPNYIVDTTHDTIDVSAGGGIVPGDDFAVWYRSKR